MPALENPFVLWLVVTAAMAGLAYAAIRTELRVRFVLYGSFLAACVVVLWPPYERAGQPGKIKLGLDLRGGIHLVLQVVTDDALVATADDSVASVRSKLGSTGIVFAEARRESPSSLVVEGVEPARVKDARDVIREVCSERDGWDVREDSATGRFTVRMTDPLVHRIREQTVDEAIKTLERRVNVLGVAEPVIGRYGSSGDQILVQLPGLTDREQARNIIIRTALLALKLVEDSGPTREALLQNFGGKVPDNMEVVPGLGDDNQQVYYLVRREAVITGRDLKTARAGVDGPPSATAGKAAAPA